MFWLNIIRLEGFIDSMFAFESVAMCNTETCSISNNSLKSFGLKVTCSTIAISNFDRTFGKKSSKSKLALKMTFSKEELSLKLIDLTKSEASSIDLEYSLLKL